MGYSMARVRDNFAEAGDEEEEEEESDVDDGGRDRIPISDGGRGGGDSRDYTASDQDSKSVSRNFPPSHHQNHSLQHPLLQQQPHNHQHRRDNNNTNSHVHPRDESPHGQSNGTNGVGGRGGG